GVCTADPKPATCLPQDCKSGQCNPATGVCEYVPASGTCGGAAGCYTNGVCSGGICSGDKKVDCSTVDGPCATGMCNPSNGQCTAVAKADGVPCTPGGKCSAAGVCTQGVCQPDAKVCPQTDPCKIATCDPKTGLCADQPRTAGGPCDPHNSCL